MLLLVLALSVLVGVTIGLLGGGGSILLVPLLVYVDARPPKEAMTMSLFIVGVTAVFGVFRHAREGRVAWRIGGIFTAAAMVGSYAGGRLAHYIDGRVLLLLFALLMLSTALAMIRGRRPGADGPHEPHYLVVLLVGVLVGLATGTVGAGGGFLIVPALTLLAGLPMPVAVGTSLFSIALNSAAGFAGHLTGTVLDWGSMLEITAATVAGVLVGSRLTGRVHPDRLRSAFGWFVLAMGAFILVQSLLGR